MQYWFVEMFHHSCKEDKNEVEMKYEHFSQQKNILTRILCAHHLKYLHVTKPGLKPVLEYCFQFYDKSHGKNPYANTQV